MSETAYCYYCGAHHPIGEMRQVLTKNGMRWRCIKTIEASRQGLAGREAFGRQTTANHKAEAQAKMRMLKAAQQ